ncbi:NAD(P)-binding domain-containing protein [Microbacterium sp.]|uniref:NADPH-dependent F420 reductase n=1 Tax=Microbacterium sp. TaxID=51671 RepID=UPI00333E6110
MRIAIIGTGNVGSRLAEGWTVAGHDVRVGSRSPRGGDLTPQDAVAGADVVVVAVPGSAAVDALRPLAPLLGGVIVVDVSNAVEVRDGVVVLSHPGTSVAELLQRALPDAHIVKTLNLVNDGAMVPRASPRAAELTNFIAGDDAGAREVARRLLVDLGWADGALVDLPALDYARALEQGILLLTGARAEVSGLPLGLRLVTDAPD